MSCAPTNQKCPRMGDMSTARLGPSVRAPTAVGETGGSVPWPTVAADSEAPDRTTWSGQRDHVMLTTFYNTGARVSEIIAMRTADVEVGRSASVHINGKSRKQRVTPL